MKTVTVKMVYIRKTQIFKMQGSLKYEKFKYLEMCSYYCLHPQIFGNNTELLKNVLY